MRKIKYSILLVLMLICITTKVNASGDIVLSGEGTVKSGESNKVTASISSSDVIGLVTGKIEYSENIESITVSAIETGKENDSWSLTYNSTTGVFNIYNAYGTKDRQLIEIKYKVKSNVEGTATITLSDLKATTVDYTTKNLENITKSITISKVADDKPTEDDKDKEPVLDDKEEEYEEDKEVEKIPGQSTEAKGELPKTGEKNIILILLAVIIVGYISYKKYMKYIKV